MKTRAIALTRLRMEARLVAYVCAASAIIGFLQPHGTLPLQDALRSNIATPSVGIAGPMFFGTLLGIAVALIQRRAGRLHELELIEQSAPIFGRELARATAIVPCVTVLAALFVYWAAQFVSGFAAPPLFFALSSAAVMASTLVALSATLRRGAARFLYIVLACAVAAIAYVLAMYVDTLGVLGSASELTFCALIVFIALRQYGEALARYDPVPD